MTLPGSPSATARSTLEARGKAITDTPVLTTAVGGQSYTVEIDVEIEPGCQSGLLLFYDPEHMTGILIDSDGIGARLGTGFIPSRYEKGATRATLRDSQRPPGSRLLFPRTRESMATYAGVCGNFGHAAQCARRLSRCSPGTFCVRIRQSNAAQFPLLAGSQSAIMRSGQLLLFVLCFIASLSAQPSSQLELGRLQSGAIVSFVRSTSGEWGIEIAGGPAPRISQPKPARLELSPTEEETRELATGYKTVRKSAEGIDALAEIPYGENVVFRVQDHWALSGPVLSVRRKLRLLATRRAVSTPLSY